MRGGARRLPCAIRPAQGRRKSHIDTTAAGRGVQHCRNVPDMRLRCTPSQPHARYRAEYTHGVGSVAFGQTPEEVNLDGIVGTKRQELRCAQPDGRLLRPRPHAGPPTQPAPRGGPKPAARRPVRPALATPGTPRGAAPARQRVHSMRATAALVAGRSASSDRTSHRRPAATARRAVRPGPTARARRRAADLPSDTGAALPRSPVSRHHASAACDRARSPRAARRGGTGPSAAQRQPSGAANSRRPRHQRRPLPSAFAWEDTSCG